MRFDDIYGRYKGKQIRTDEAAELLGISVRTFYRKGERFDEEGFDGRFDYRLGKPAINRAEDSEVQKMTRLYEERYHGFNVKHFHEYAQREHGLKYGYTWAKNTLEKAGLIRKGKRGGDHRLRRERRPMEGMMLHQDGVHSIGFQPWIITLISWAFNILQPIARKPVDDQNGCF